MCQDGGRQKQDRQNNPIDNHTIYIGNRQFLDSGTSTYVSSRAKIVKGLHENPLRHARGRSMKQKRPARCEAKLAFAEKPEVKLRLFAELPVHGR